MSLKSIAPIILSVALVLLAAGSGWLAYSYSSLALSDITGVATSESKGQPSAKFKTEDMQASVASWNTPVLWTEPDNQHRLFNSADYLFYPSLYPSGNYIQANDGTARSTGGVLLSWYQKYGLDITSPTVDRDDPDGDGFSNITEYKNEQVGERLKASDCDGSKSTNPLDAQSHPSYLSRLRLQKYESRPFHIRFNSYTQLNGAYLFQIFVNDLPSYRQPPLKKTGDPLGFEGYTVGEFHQNIVSRMNDKTHIEEQIDESTLDLEKPDIGWKISLPFQQDTDSPESTADFVMLMPTEVDKVIKVARGKILTVPYIPASEAQYLVLEANDDGAKIRDTKTKQEYHILKLDPAEWEEVPLPQANASAKAP